MQKYPSIIKFSDISYSNTGYALVETENDYIDWCTINGNTCWIEEIKEIPWHSFRDASKGINRPIGELYTYLLSDLDVWGDDLDKYFEFLYSNISEPKLGYHFKTSMVEVYGSSKPKALTSTCTHSKKYKNTVSKTLSFWVCPNCKADLGNA